MEKDPNETHKMNNHKLKAANDNFIPQRKRIQRIIGWIIVCIGMIGAAYWTVQLDKPVHNTQKLSRKTL